MARFKYQQSAYGDPWETRVETNDLSLLNHARDALWLKMLPERHHRIIDTDNDDLVLWGRVSLIAPLPNTRN
jgi:hypothetical protein